MALVVALALIDLLLVLQEPLVQGQACPSTCGALTVPFPFGVSPGCGIPELQLICTGDVLRLQTPSGNYQVLNLTDRSLVINTTDFKASGCDGPFIPSGKATFILPVNGSFALSENNRFFVNGCNAAGSFITDRTMTPPECKTGCENDKPQYPFCNIYSCCVAPIPTGSREVYIRGGGTAYKTGGCSFSSMVYPPSYVTVDQLVIGSGTYGVELSFAAPGNCSEKTFCTESATCVDVPTIPGHLCSCPIGLVGDGYLNGTGCVAVDYCLQSERHCHQDARCSTGPGSVFHCQCKSGFVGDGKVSGSGCISVRSHVPVILGSLAAVSSVICVSLIFSCQVLRRRDRRKMEKPKLCNDSVLTLKRFQSVLSTTRGKEQASIFTYKELERATKGFSPDVKLGFGGFGTVYRGTLADNTTVAIKRANHAGAQGSAQFLNEVTILSQVNHRNLVKLLGCCIDTEVPLLVYEYVPNGTLFEHLQGLRSGILSWEERLRIGLETAEALAYLHSAAVPPIYHRDVKSSNILLDENLTAKVADFGISKLVPTTATHVSTAVQGTPGYLDPEYYQNYQLTDKTDVYSFGVVLLEIITGQKPVDFSRQSRDINLAALSIPLIKRDLVEEIIDKRAEAPDEEMATRINKVAKLAVQCLAFHRDDRPSMKKVVEELVKTKGDSVTRVRERDKDMKSVESEYLVDGLRNIADLFPLSFSATELKLQQLEY